MLEEPTMSQRDSELKKRHACLDQDRGCCKDQGRDFSENQEGMRIIPFQPCCGTTASVLLPSSTICVPCFVRDIDTVTQGPHSLPASSKAAAEYTHTGLQV